MTHSAARRPALRLAVLSRGPGSALLLLLGAMVPLAAPLAAQQPDSAGPIELRPVLVRASTPDFILGAPRPIATLTGADLGGARAGLFLEEAVQALPGVQIQNRYNLAVGERISVRGFGGRAQFGVRGLRVIVDGIPATMADGQTTLDHLDVASIGRVEALRGPGAALYGNSAGGVLHFATLAPPPGRPQPELLAVAGAHGLRQLRGTVAGTAGGIGYRASGAHILYDGFRRDPVADDGSIYGVAERSSLNATASGDVGRGRLRFVLNALDLAAENPGSLTAQAFADGTRPAFTGNVNQRTRKDVRQAQAGLSWDRNVGAGRGEVAAYGLLRGVDNPIPSDVIVLDRAAWGARALLEQPLGGDRVRAGGGVELDLQRDDRRNYGNSGGTRGSLRLDQFERVRSAGAFGFIRASVHAALDLSAGVRYDTFRFSVSDRFVTDTDPDDSGRRNLSALSPSLGMTARLHDHLELYGTVSSSYETPSTTELANRPDGAGGFNPSLDPQRGVTWDGGARWRPAEAVLVELSAHHTALRDELVPFEVPGVPGRTFYDNAGRSRHQGVELSAAAAAGPWSGRAAYAWLDARYVDFRRGGNTFDGNRIPGMAPHMLDGVLRWAPTLGYVEVRGQYRSTTPADDANSAEAPAHFVLDLRMGADAWRAGDFELSPMAGINNALDRRYAAAVAVNAFGGRFFEPGPPRSVWLGLRASIRWP